jgi:hypothetical protein
VAGDQLSLAATAAFADPEIGNAKLVAVSAIHVASGADSGNYVLAADSATTTADIVDGDPPPVSTGTASLPPVLPPAAPPPVTTAPPAALDLTLPEDLGAGLTPGVDTGAGAGAGAGVAISLLRTATNDYYGMVSVLVPLNSRGFTFVLSAAVIQGAAPSDVRVTLVNGGALPSWLRYVPARHAFVATNPPTDALPIQALVRIGRERWTVVISERETP